MRGLYTQLQQKNSYIKLQPVTNTFFLLSMTENVLSQLYNGWTILLFEFLCSRRIKKISHGYCTIAKTKTDFNL